jgi:hypothetical protein
MTRRTLTVAVLTSFVGIAVLVAAAQGSISSSAPAIGQSSLQALTRQTSPIQPAALPASVQEVANALGANGEATEQPTDIPGASVYLIPKGTNQLCFVIDVVDASGSCDSTLRDAGGSLDGGLAIVDGKCFVWGLVADGVESASVSLSGSSTTPATQVAAPIIGNTFLAQVPYNGGGVGGVTFKITRNDGTTGLATLSAVPIPADD